MHGLTKMIVGSMFLATLAVPAMADRIAEVEKELIQAHGKLKSFTAKIHSSYDSGTEDESMWKSETKGTHEWMRQGELVLYRMETVRAAVSKMAGQDSVSKTKATTVCEGEYTYMLSDTDGQKSATKLKTDPRSGGDVAMTFESMRAEYDLKLLPDETVNGQSCYVIEETRKKGGQDPGHSLARYVIHMSKETGLLVKSIGYDADGKTMSTSDTTDIKINVPISPDRFKFVAPKGVTVIDMARMMENIQVPRTPESSGE